MLISSVHYCFSCRYFNSKKQRIIGIFTIIDDKDCLRILKRLYKDVWIDLGINKINEKRQINIISKKVKGDKSGR